MMKKLLAPEPTEGAASTSANMHDGMRGHTTTTESHSHNVITQGRSTNTEIVKGAEEDSYSDSSSSTSSLSDSDSSSDSDSD